MRRIVISAMVLVSGLGLTACAPATEIAAQQGSAPAAARVEHVQVVAVQLGAGRLNRQLPNELDDRLYLRHVPVDPRGLLRFAGAVLNFYGDVHPDGSCTLDSTRAPSLEMHTYVRDSARLQIELLSALKYQSIMDRTAVANGGLVIANLALRDSQLAEIIIEDVAKIEALEALDFAGLDRLQQDTLPLGVCRRNVIAAAYLTSIKSRVYRQTGGQGIVTGMGFGLDGRFYVTNSDFGSNLLLSVDARLVRERRIVTSAAGRSGLASVRLLPAPVLAGLPATPLAAADTPR